MDDPILVDDLRPSKPPSASVYDDMFESYFNRATEPSEPSPKASSSSSTPPPVFDKPVFDDDPDAADPFDAIPLFGGGSGGGDAEEDFLGGPGRADKSEGIRETAAVGFDDELFPGLGGSARSTEPVRGAVEPDQEAVGFDDLIAGFGGSVTPAPPVEPEELLLDDGVIPRFGGSTHHHNSARDDPMTRQESEPVSSSKTSVSMPEDPFVILGATPTSEYSSFGLFSDYLDYSGMPEKSENTKADAPVNTSGRFQGTDMLAGFTKAMPSISFASEKESDTTERRSVDRINSMSQSNHVLHGKPVQRGSAEAAANILPEMNVSEPSVVHEIPIATGFRSLNPFDMDDLLPEENKDLNPFDMDDLLPEENKDSKMPDEVWLTVSDITLVTQPTRAPPPSRPPPTLATKQVPIESVTTKTYPHNHNQGSVGSVDTPDPESSQVDELEDFFMAKPAKFANGHPRVLNHEGTVQYASAGNTSFVDQVDSRNSKGMNQSFMGQDDFGSVFTRSQYHQEQKDDNLDFFAHEMEKTEKTDEDERLGNEQRQKEHDERRAEREKEEELEREREKVKQREQEEQKRHEKEREARQAVEKAIREARERASVEACMRAESEARRRAERAAVQKVAAEARERAAAEARERAAKAAAEAKERAAAESRERAAADARERAAAESRERAARAKAEAREKAAAESQEKAATEARAKAERAAVEKAAAEARRRAERAVFERVAAEARQRAANEARERAAAEARARENQQRTATAQPDLESFFGTPSRSSSVPRSQTTTTNPFDVHPQGSSGSDTGTVRRPSSGSASPFTQHSSSNLMDDLSSIFGAPSSSVFQELDGESEERRKARLERHQRTMERAAKALAEKNERDLQARREQEERHRIGETLDFEIKRWAAGKEGNLRALLSTLQYVLWPECGWRPVSLTDMITAASVKKEYRKATLCIHPDKVQQKGANLQQKYVAEKVFDLLKEAWNKFNSEELF